MLQDVTVVRINVSFGPLKLKRRPGRSLGYVNGSLLFTVLIKELLKHCIAAVRKIAGLVMGSDLNK